MKIRLPVIALATTLGLAAAGPALSPAGTTADDRPRYRLPAGTTVHVLGTNIVCQIHPTQPFISCFRVAKRGSKLVEAPGGYGFVVKADGDLLVNRLRGARWTFEFGRVSQQSTRIVRPGRSARAAKAVFRMRLRDQFWVPGSRVVCHVAVDGRVRAIQCGFVDSQARIAAPGTFGAGLSGSGTAYVIRFDGARRPTEVFNSRGTGTERTVKVGVNANIFVRLPGGRAITCGGIVADSLKVMSCGTEQAGVSPPVAGDYDFLAVQDGTIGVRFRGRVVYSNPGRGIRRSGVDELPTPGVSFEIEPGQSFKLAGTQTLCQVAAIPQAVVHCGFSDRFGLGVPGTQTVAIRGDGAVAVIRWDRLRRPTPVFNIGP